MYIFIVFYSCNLDHYLFIILQAFTTDFRIHWGQHPLRPEFVESTYFIYKVSIDVTSDSKPRNQKIAVQKFKWKVIEKFLSIVKKFFSIVKVVVFLMPTGTLWNIMAFLRKIRLVKFAAASWK